MQEGWMDNFDSHCIFKKQKIQKTYTHAYNPHQERKTTDKIKKHQTISLLLPLRHSPFTEKNALEDMSETEQKKSKAQTPRVSWPSAMTLCYSCSSPLHFVL